MFPSDIENYTGFAKVYDKLPTRKRPNTFYAVLKEQGTKVDWYLTTIAGVPIPIISNELIVQLIEEALNNANNNIKSIDGYTVDVTNNTDKDIIETGNIIRGLFTSDRYIIARVDALPHTDINNLTCFLNVKLL